MSVLTKCWRMRRSISLLFLPSKVPSSWLLPDLADVLSTCNHQVWCCRWPPCFYRRTLSFVPARHAETSQILASTKYRCPPNFTNSSQYLCSQASYQKLINAKSNHHHCPISVFLLMSSIQRLSQRSTAWPLSCSNGVGVPDGGGGGKGGKACKGPYHIKVKGGLYNFPSWSLFRLSLGCLWDSPSIVYSITMIRTELMN